MHCLWWSIFLMAAPALAKTQQPIFLAQPSTIPLLGFGTWALHGSNGSEAVSVALQTGYDHIDCAAIYGNEKEVGRGIEDGLKKSGRRREHVWITSKLWNDRSGSRVIALEDISC